MLIPRRRSSSDDTDTTIMAALSAEGDSPDIGGDFSPFLGMEASSSSLRRFVFILLPFLAALLLRGGGTLQLSTETSKVMFIPTSRLLRDRDTPGDLTRLDSERFPINAPIEHNQLDFRVQSFRATLKREAERGECSKRAKKADRRALPPSSLSPPLSLSLPSSPFLWP